MIIGIDPGLTGAIAVIDHGLIIEIHDMPVTAKNSGKGNQVNAGLLADLFEEIDGSYIDENYVVSSVVIERVGAMPGQGVSSMFSFGRSLGVVEGVIASKGWPVEWVTPQKWKKKFGLIGKDKDAARTLCIEQHPSDIGYFKRKKDIGRADALLIAKSILRE